MISGYYEKAFMQANSHSGVAEQPRSYEQEIPSTAIAFADVINPCTTVMSLYVQRNPGLVALKQVVRRAARWSVSLSRLADGAAALVGCFNHPSLPTCSCGLSLIQFC